jgi:hypothetical protein
LLGGRQTKKNRGEKFCLFIITSKSTRALQCRKKNNIPETFSCYIYVLSVGQAKRKEMTIWLGKHSHTTFTYDPQDKQKGRNDNMASLALPVTTRRDCLA